MKLIPQGASQNFKIELATKNNNSNVQRAYDLTGYTEITACLKVGGTKAAYKQTDDLVTVVGSPSNGIIVFDFLPVDSDQFNAGVGDIDIVVAKGVNEVVKFQILNAFKIVEKIC